MSTTIKPSRAEEEYFIKQEIDKLKRMAKETNDKYAEQEREKLKKMHEMHCPKCGLELQQIQYRGFVLEKCFNCGVMVLDQDEFQKLAGKEEGFVASIVGLFK